jgi:hypothetical protein
MTRVRAALIVAAMANILGWALPVIDKYRGWQAFRVALSPLWPYEQFTIPAGYLVALSVASALTNLLFWVVAIALLRGPSLKSARVCLWLAAGATLLDLHWQTTLRENAADLRAGYFVWVVSFALLALAAYFEVVGLRASRKRP